MNRKSMLFAAAFACAAFHTATAQSWNITGNSNATSSSKLGTTNAVPLRLFTNNVQRATITSDGFMGINTTAPPGLFTVQSNGSVPSALWAPSSTKPVFFGFSESLNADFSLAAASNDPKQRPLFFAKRSRGTLASPTAVKTDDFLSSMAVYAYDGSAFQIPATIDFYADGTPSSGKVPSRISFVTGSNAGNRLERLKIGSTGDISMNNNQLFIKQSSGSVGLGTATPSSDNKLEIVGGTTSSSSGIYVTSTGNGIQTTGSAFGVLANSDNIALYGSGTYAGVSAYSGGSNGYGILANGYYGVYGTGNFGVYATSSTSTGDGVHSNVSGSSNYGVNSYSANSIGVYGNTGNTGSYAGYFNGNVYSSGTYTSSDAKLKKNVTAVDNAMSIISRLQPKYYEFRNDGNFAKMNLPAGKHFGLIAQDLEKVLPDLVKQSEFNTAKSGPDEATTASVSFGKDGKPVKTATVQPVKEGKDEIIDFKAVNYTELIPIVIKGMQEQQAVITKQEAQISDQQQQINELKELVKQLAGIKDIKTGLNSVTLEQNNPNPLDKFTTIRYTLPEGSTNAQLVVTDMSGKTIKQVQLTSTAGNVNFDAAGLASGTYSYSIIVNGKLMQTKKMVVVRANH